MNGERLDSSRPEQKTIRFRRYYTADAGAEPQRSWQEAKLDPSKGYFTLGELPEKMAPAPVLTRRQRVLTRIRRWRQRLGSWIAGGGQND